MARPADPLDPLAGLWHFLGVELRRLREEHGLSQDEAGALCGYSGKRFSNWERAVESRPRIEPMRTLDNEWNTGGRLATLHHYASTVQDPIEFLPSAEYEAQATVIRLNAVTWLPGLLQTPDYARVAFTAYGAPNVGDQVTKRMERQKVLTRTNPPHVSMLLSEAALLLVPSEVAEKQLERLRELSELPHVGIRLVPLSAGLHPGLDGSFQLFSTPEREVGYVETPARGRLVTEADDLRRLAVTFDRTGWVALSPEATRDRLREMIERLPK